MDIAKFGASPSTKTAFDPFNSLAIPADVSSSAAKKGASPFTVADMPASFLPTPEATKPAPSTETPAAASTPTDNAEPIRIEFGPNGSYSQVATSAASTTPAAASSSVVVSDAARSAAKSTLASIDAKLAQSGYSKPIGNQRDRTDAINEVAKGLRGEAKAKFLADIKTLAAPLGLNFGRRRARGGKAQFDKLGAEQQAINRELYQEWKTGTSAAPSAAPAAAAKTATPAPAVKPAEAKREAADAPKMERSGQLNDLLNKLKLGGEAYAIKWAESLVPAGFSRVDSSMVAIHGSAGPWVGNQQEVAALVKRNMTPGEFGRAMHKLANE